VVVDTQKVNGARGVSEGGKYGYSHPVGNTFHRVTQENVVRKKRKGHRNRKKGRKTTSEDTQIATGRFLERDSIGNGKQTCGTLGAWKSERRETKYHVKNQSRGQ